MSPTLSQLQHMLNECIEFGKKHSIKFNGLKTQFVISGQSPIANPNLTMESLKIPTKTELKHLGFKWGTSSRKYLTLNKHKESRVSELWATSSSLISSGVRWYHPSTTSTVFKSIIVPKVLYGVEIFDVDKYFESLLNKQCRNSLKSLWGISKHARNDLNKFYHLFDITPNIKTRKVKFLQHIMRNQTTRKYLLSLLTLKDRQFSTLQNTFDIVVNENLDLINVLLDQLI